MWDRVWGAAGGTGCSWRALPALVMLCSLCQPRALVCAVSSLPKQPIPTGPISSVPSLQTLALFAHDKSSAVAGPLRNGDPGTDMIVSVQDIAFVCTVWAIPSVITLNVWFWKDNGCNSPSTHILSHNDSTMSLLIKFNIM